MKSLNEWQVDAYVRTRRAQDRPGPHPHLRAGDRQRAVGVPDETGEGGGNYFGDLLCQLMTAQLRVHDLDLDIMENADVSALSHGEPIRGVHKAEAPCRA